MPKILVNLILIVIISFGDVMEIYPFRDQIGLQILNPNVSVYATRSDFSQNCEHGRSEKSLLWLLTIDE